MKTLQRQRGWGIFGIGGLRGRFISDPRFLPNVTGSSLEFSPHDVFQPLILKPSSSTFISTVKTGIFSFCYEEKVA